MEKEQIDKKLLASDFGCWISTPVRPKIEEWKNRPVISGCEQLKGKEIEEKKEVCQ